MAIGCKCELANSAPFILIKALAVKVMQIGHIPFGEVHNLKRMAGRIFRMFLVTSLRAAHGL
jgi:hypothetical protein